ncbi:MAG: peptide chain release factor N(5)-glutamine methyltransferase [Leptolyngbyaceae cyanobacterium SL_7_1]|nr:peptide chain release factor N(5)-glutamine methyltransferase [Leptolyngbyaceae cyanobacterium SL_7_1]
MTHSPYLVSGSELWQWRSHARQQAAAAEIPLAEVDWLLQAVSQLEPLALRLESFKQQARIELERSLPQLDQLWQQRLEARVPVQYLVGSVPWRQFELQVSPAVLIPRPETEYLIDLAVAVGEQGDLTQGDWVDLGTGSGAIAIGLAHAFPHAQIHAVDVSEVALAIARANAQRWVGDRVQFYQGSWFEPLEHLKGQLSGMVSNPPYIPRALVPTLQPEVANHEPHLALDGGEDGLACVRQLMSQAPEYLRSQAVWLVELMAGQANTVIDLLRQHGAYEQVRSYQDLAGIDRFVLARRR